MDAVVKNEYQQSLINELGKVSKKNKKMVGFIQRSSEPSQPPNLARTLNTKLISASFKTFGTKKWKSKSLSNSWDIYPDPLNNE